MRVFSILLFFSIFVQAKTLTVGLMDSRPFFWKENGKYNGFHYELATQLTAKMKYELVVKEAPILRMINMLKKGEVDVVIVTDQPDLEALNAKKELVLELDSFLFTLPDEAITSKKEINGRIARLSKSCTALNYLKDVEWVEAESYDQAYGLLKRKRIRAVCGTVAFQIVAKEKGASVDTSFKSFLVSKKGLWIQALPGFDSATWGEVQKGLKSLIDAGAIEPAAKKLAR